MSVMTVAEFATKHADTCDCGTDRIEHIQIHVDLLVETAVAHGRVLWTVGADAEGRVSLIWDSHDLQYWTSLLSEAALMVLLKRVMGLGS